MSTQYTLFKSEEGHIEVQLSEVSEELYMTIFHNGRGFGTPMMKPSDMLRLLMEGIKNTSYWMTEDEFHKTFNELECYPYFMSICPYPN